MEPTKFLGCRGCMAVNAHHSFADDEATKTKFFQVTTLMLSDGFLCDECLEIVNYAHHFRQQCIEIDSQLKEEAEKQLMKNIKKEPEEDIDEDYYLIVIDENNVKMEKAKTNDNENNIEASDSNEDSAAIEDASQEICDSNCTGVVQFLSETETPIGDDVTQYGVDVETFVTNDADDETAVAGSGVVYTQEEIVISNGDDRLVLNGDPSNIMILDDDPITVVQQSDGSFLCDCGQVFMNFVEYEKHREDHDVFACPICPRKFESDQILIGHLTLHRTADWQVPCPFCEHSVERNMLTAHIKIQHDSKTLEKKSPKKQYECVTCFRKFETRHSLLHHCSKVHKSSDVYICFACHAKFDSEENLRVHVCSSSSVVFKSDSKERYTCSICSREYASSGSLKRHMDSVHSSEESKLLCSECGEILPSQKAMHSHSLVHKQGKIRNSKKYVCKTCNKGCASQAMLNMHERVHTGERPYKCNWASCQLAFKTKTHLTTHQLTHTQIKQFSCSVCFKNFALKGNLVVHMRTHTGERPYVCDICNSAFIDSKYLKKHKLKRHLIDTAPSVVKEEMIKIL